MNDIIFNFFFSFSSINLIADISLFVSYILIYVFIVLAILIPVFIRRDFIYALLTFCTGAFTWVAVYIIKNIFAIDRPFIALNLTPLFIETGFSFPSSHVAVISALMILVWKINRKLGFVFIAFSVLVAFSRMIIGVHYPIDVLIGGCFGMLIGLGISWFYKITNKFAFLRKYI